MTQLLLAPPNLISTRLPWQGMYDSLWDQGIDHEEEQWVEYADHEPDRYSTYTLAAIKAQRIYDVLLDHTDHGQIKLDVAKAYAEEFFDWLGDSLDLGELAGHFEEVSSPAYYNFSTDRLFCKLSLTVYQAIRDAMRGDDAQETELADAFKEHFTSRSGFCSFYDNTIPDKPLGDWDHNELFALLNAWINHQAVPSIDQELYDYNIGGLYEELGRIWDRNVDWPAVELACRQLWVEDNPDTIPPIPARCTETLPLPL